MKDEMMLVGVTLARRYTRKQKEIFLAEVCRQCREAGWKTEFQTRHSRMLHVCNLVIGDLAHAKTVIACAYDTPASAQLVANPLLSVESTEEHSGGRVEFGVGMDFGRGVLFDRCRGGLYATLVESSDENRCGFGCSLGGLAGCQLAAQPGKPR